jgi:hypothetical protein
VELLQAQYVKVFSDPKSADVDKCLRDLKPDPEKELDVIEFSIDDIVDAIKEFMHQHLMVISLLK